MFVSSFRIACPALALSYTHEKTCKGTIKNAHMQEKWLKVHFQSCFLAYGLHRATVVSGVKKLLNGDSIASACHNLMIGVKRVPHFHSNHDLLLPKSAIIVTTFLSSLQTKILNLLKVFIDLKDTTFIDCFVLATNLLSIFFYNCEPPPVEPTHPAIADEVSWLCRL